eukprot:7539497-Pyramimonas_sp.AAC.1
MIAPVTNNSVTFKLPRSFRSRVFQERGKGNSGRPYLLRYPPTLRCRLAQGLVLWLALSHPHTAAPGRPAPLARSRAPAPLVVPGRVVPGRAVAGR